MSKLDEMIRELCPDGVEYVKLNSVCDIYDGTHSTPNYTESGVKFASVENIGNLYATQKYISEKDFEKYTTIAITSGASTPTYLTNQVKDYLSFDMKKPKIRIQEIL